VAQGEGLRAQGKNDIYINQSTGAQSAELRGRTTFRIISLGAKGAGEERHLYKSEHGMVLFFVF
jgi:hypothetical protein